MIKSASNRPAVRLQHNLSLRRIRDHNWASHTNLVKDNKNKKEKENE